MVQDLRTLISFLSCITIILQDLFIHYFFVIFFEIFAFYECTLNVLNEIMMGAFKAAYTIPPLI